MSQQDKVNKVFEKNVNEYLSRLIYAVFEDIKTDWNKPLKHSNNLFQHYANLIKDKKERSDGLKSRFTIADESRQLLRFLFDKMLEELNNTDLETNDSLDSIQSKVTVANADCYLDFMFGVAAANKKQFGATLLSASDPTRWFYNQIIAKAAKHASKPVVIAHVSQEFDSFLKALAWKLGKLLWYHETSINEGLFTGTIAQLAMNQIMMDTMVESLREKPPQKPRVKKAGEKTTEGETAGETTGETETAEPETPVNEIPTVEIAGDSALGELINAL